MMTTFSYIFYYVYDVDDINILNPTKCKIQAFLMIMFENSQYIWATIIGFYVYQAVYNFEEIENISVCYKRVIYISIGFGIPLVISFVCFECNVLGASRNTRWCWIGPIDEKHQTDPNIAYFQTILYAFVWILIIINFILNCKALRYLNRHFVSIEEQQMIKGYIWKLLRYPFIQIICILPGTINRLMQIIWNRNNATLQVFQLIFTTLEGLLFAIAYGYTTQVKSTLSENLNRYFYYCPCFRRKKIRRSESESSENTQRLCDRSGNCSENNNTVDALL